MMKIKKFPNIVTISKKTVIDRHLKFGMLLWTIKYYIFPKYQCKKKTFFQKLLTIFDFDEFCGFSQFTSKLIDLEGCHY